MILPLFFPLLLFLRNETEGSHDFALTSYNLITSLSSKNKSVLTNKSLYLNAASAIGKVRLATLEATADFAKAQASGVSYGLMGAAMIPINPIQGAALIASGTAATTAATAGLAAAKIAGVVQTATIGVTSAAQIAAILSVGKDSKTVSSGGSSGGGQAATPSFNGTVNVPAPVIGASQATQSGNLGQTIVGAVEAGNSRNRPIQAYVIGGQVTTQQQLDRRIAVAAKMGG